MEEEEGAAQTELMWMTLTWAVGGAGEVFNGTWEDEGAAEDRERACWAMPSGGELVVLQWINKGRVEREVNPPFHTVRMVQTLPSS